MALYDPFLPLGGTENRVSSVRNVILGYFNPIGVRELFLSGDAWYYQVLTL